MEKILFLEELFFEKMWGGTTLSTIYKEKYVNKTIPLGEIWGISGHQNGINIIKNGKYKGKDLNWLWNNTNYFGRTKQGMVFPIQLRLVDAKQQLSVQVHPNDDYARTHANDNGKHECWYVLNCKKNAKIIYGQACANKEALEEYIADRKVEEIMNRIPIKNNDFIYVPAGLVHAIGDETFLLELAECSDTTYRFYDYERADQEGNQRPLHIQESLDVINWDNTYPLLEQKTEYFTDAMREQLIDNSHFTSEYIHCAGFTTMKKTNPYYACYVISGQATVNQIPVKQGDFFIHTTACDTLEIDGNIEIFAAYKRGNL